MPDYDEYFQRLESCSEELKDFVGNYLAIPVEGSRGCWWSKCTFCNLNAQYKGYREKPVEQVVAEVEAQVRRYRCHNIRFVDNVQRIKGFARFMTALRDLNLGLSFFMELRAGRLEKQDYALMRDAGVKIVQIGVEAVGNRMLKKINKGVTVIDNIATVKYCQECGILPFYNVIHSYPNEDEADLEETARNIECLKSIIPPMSLIPLGVGQGSPIQQHPAEFNIKEMARPKTSWQYPEHV